MGSGVPLGQQVRALSVADRVRLARQANRPVRALLIRDTEKRIHVEVVKNPKTTDDEIVDWSALPGISPLALKWISTQKRLMRNRVLQLNLVKNPMTPQNIALKLVKLLHISDCRKIAKSSQVREAIARVARKRVAEYVEKMWVSSTRHAVWNTQSAPNEQAGRLGATAGYVSRPRNVQTLLVTKLMPVAAAMPISSDR